MSDDDRRYLQPVSRTAQVVTGILSLFLGPIVLSLCALGIVVASEDRHAPPGIAVFVGVAFVIGLLCLVLGWRLLRGRGRRQDGSLLSPIALRIAALLFLAMPIAPVVFVIVGLRRIDVVAFLETTALLGMAAASWKLARSRSSRPQRRQDA